MNDSSKEKLRSIGTYIFLNNWKKDKVFHGLLILFAQVHLGPCQTAITKLLEPIFKR